MYYVNISAPLAFLQFEENVFRYEAINNRKLYVNGVSRLFSRRRGKVKQITYHIS